ncbi:MAG: trypsin-like serine protease [Tannerella sp.]|jgi:secreted trypsin-like serine protease|nr:trypsin-like serine protease [Tannerella sp.]
MKNLSLLFLVFVVAFQGLNAQQNITGGDDINITSVPWQVLVNVNGNDNGGGSIVAPNFILTAKHVVETSPGGSIYAPSAVKVYAGITCRSEKSSSNTFNVTNIIPHPTMDVALLQLSTNITFNSNRNAINWASTDNSLYNAGRAVRVSGWGWLTPFGNAFAPCLQAVDVHIISNQDASNMLGTILAAYEMATTGVGSIRQGACNGDSGGPLTTLSNSNEPMLIGVVNWALAGCSGNNGNSPSVYLRVSSILNWIGTNIINISGPNAICSGSSSFSVSNAPNGFTWNSSSNLNISGSGTNVSVSTVSGANGAGWISINHGGVELARKNVWIGVPPTPLISGPSSVSTSSQPVTYYANIQGYTSSTITNYEWSWQSDPANPMYSYGNYINIYFNVAGSSRLSLRASNSCGYSPWQYLYINAGGSLYVTYYPNPVSDVLNIEVKTKDAVSARSIAAASYDIRLYDGQGTQLRQTVTKGESNTQFDVSGLPNGTYYLHVYDGVNAKPEMYQIIVKH